MKYISLGTPLSLGPCCPDTLSVEQMTQAMTNVVWSPAVGAHSYVTSLTSPRGHAKCHTMDTHCLMGCITCNTHYNVSLEAISITGHKTQCNYHGFSSSEFKAYHYIVNTCTRLHAFYTLCFLRLVLRWVLSLQCETVPHAEQHFAGVLALFSWPVQLHRRSVWYQIQLHLQCRTRVKLM